MGLFDVRCAVSRISTRWRPTVRERWTVSMFLVEKIDDAFVPWTPPVRGSYDGYGALELSPGDVSPFTEWAGERLWSLWERGDLVTSWPADLEAEQDRGKSRLERWLGHGAETAYNGAKITIDGRPVGACIVLDAVADAIAAADPAPPTTLDAALAAWFPEGGAGRRHFADAPADALPQLARYASVRAYADAHGGFAPIRAADARQHSEETLRRSVQQAWHREDGPIRGMLDALAPAWTVRWRGARATEVAAEKSGRDHAAVLAGASVVPYAPRDAFKVGQVLEHPRFGRGRVEELVEVGKIRVRFLDDTRVLVHRVGKP